MRARAKARIVCADNVVLVWEGTGFRIVLSHKAFQLVLKALYSGCDTCYR